MLFERQRHVQVVNPFALRDLGDFRQLAEQRQSTVADVVATGAISEIARRSKLGLTKLGSPNQGALATRDRSTPCTWNRP